MAIERKAQKEEEDRMRLEMEKVEEAKKKKNPRSRYAAVNSKKAVVKPSVKSLAKPASAELNSFKSPTNRDTKKVGSFLDKPSTGKPNGRMNSTSRLISSSRIGLNTRSTTTLLRK